MVGVTGVVVVERGQSQCVGCQVSVSGVVRVGVSVSWSEAVGRQSS